MDSDSKGRPSLSVVIPAYNEEATIQRALAEAETALAALGNVYEILIVDDGSTDRTAELAAEAGGPRVRVIRHGENLGYGAALRTGFSEAKGDLVGFTDADCQFDLGELDRLILLCRDYDCACGYRLDRQDPPLRRFLAGVYNTLVRLLFRTGVRDCDCALKLFRREVLQAVEITTDGFFINAEVLARLRRAQASIVEVGVTHRPRIAGTSTVGWRNSLPVLRQIARFWWRWELFPAAQAGAESEGVATTWKRFAILLAVVGPLLFLSLSYPLIHPDETRYAQIPAEMLASGDYVVPTLDGEPYLDKPPLLYWVTAGIYHVLGVSDRSARLAAALAALGTVLAGFWIGRRVVGERAAWLGTLAFASSLGIVGSGRFLTTDPLLVTMVTTSLLAAILGVGGDRYRPGWWVLSGLACGLGVLTKGPVALVLLLPPIIVGRWLSGSTVRLTLGRWIAFVAPIAALTAPWFVLISETQPRFVSYFFLRHHLQRFVNAFDHALPWWFYGPSIVVLLLPSTIVLPALIARLIRRRAESREGRTRDEGYLILSALWTIGFFSLSSSKLPSYIIPALPPLGLLVGRLFDRELWRKNAPDAMSSALPRMAVVCSLFFVVVAGFIDIVMDGEARIEGHQWAGAMIAGALILAVLTASRVLRSDHRRWLAAAVVVWLGWAFFFFDVVPEVAYLRALPRQARELAVQKDGQSLPIIAVGRRFGPGMMYMRHDEITDLAPEDAEPIRQWLEESPRVVLIADRKIAGTVAEYAADRVVEELDEEGHLFLIEHRPAGSAPVSAAAHSG
jgi:4-amino-4-deoxy-L-arabinose transferase-like glycosyltransferase